MNDPWSVLGINSGSDTATVKAAYRKLVKTMHPDIAGNDPKSRERFQQVQSAYKTLTAKHHPQRQISSFQRWIGLEEVMTGCIIDIEIGAKGAAVAIPCGVHNGDKVVADTDNGQIVVEILVRNHPDYQRHFSDLVMVLDIDAVDAMLGATQKVIHFGAEIDITIPAGIQHGDIICVPEMGLPHRGDVIHRAI